MKSDHQTGARLNGRPLVSETEPECQTKRFGVEPNCLIQVGNENRDDSTGKHRSSLSHGEGARATAFILSHISIISPTSKSSRRRHHQYSCGCERDETLRRSVPNA